MKTGWSETTLGNFAEIRYGYTAKANSEPVGPRFLRITDIQNGTVSWDQVPYCSVSAKDYAKHSLHEGDIVFARTGATTGKSFLIREAPDAVCASYLIKVRSDGEQATPEYLSIFFQSAEYWREIALGTEGAAQGGFNASKLAALKVPLPPLDEQRRIVAVLDEAFEGLARARANAEANLENAKELYPQLRNRLLESGDGWRNITLSELLDRITYGFTNPMPNAERGPYKVTAKNVVGGVIDYEAARRTTPEAFRDLLTNKSRPKVGDVLLTKDGTLGRTAVVDRDDICVNQSVAVLTPNEDVLPKYLSEMLSCSKHQEAMIADAGGTTIKHLYITRVPKITVEVPMLDQQHDMLDELSKKNELCRRVEKEAAAKLKDLDDLRQSLLQRAFAGELT